MMDILVYLFCAIVGFYALMFVSGIAVFFVARTYVLIGRKWASMDPEREKAWHRKQAAAEVARAAEKHRNRIVGKVYLITDKELRKPELWLTEEEDRPIDLFTKFGWYQHKRSRYAGSLSHSMHYMAENVLFDPKLHKHFNPKEFAGDSRRIRLIRYDALEFEPHLYDLYAIVDRVKKRVEKYYVPLGRVDEFLANAGEAEFRTVILAVSQTRLPIGHEANRKLSERVYVGGALQPL